MADDGEQQFIVIAMANIKYLRTSIIMDHENMQAHIQVRIISH